MLFRVHLLRELLVGLLCLAFTHPLADQVEDLLLGNLHGRLLASLLLSVSPGATQENSSWRKLPARGPEARPGACARPGSGHRVEQDLEALDLRLLRAPSLRGTA